MFLKSFFTIYIYCDTVNVKFCMKEWGIIVKKNYLVILLICVCLITTVGCGNSNRFKTNGFNDVDNTKIQPNEQNNQKEQQNQKKEQQQNNNKKTEGNGTRTLRCVHEYPLSYGQYEYNFKTELVVTQNTRTNEITEILVNHTDDVDFYTTFYGDGQPLTKDEFEGIYCDNDDIEYESCVVRVTDKKVYTTTEYTFNNYKYDLLEDLDDKTVDATLFERLKEAYEVSSVTCSIY